MSKNDLLSFYQATQHRSSLSALRRIREIHQLLDSAMAMLEATISDAASNHSTSFSPISTADDSQAQDLKTAKSLYRFRRERSKVLPDRILGEPAWDMLLDLYIAHCERRETSISSLCIAASVPGTTALRWIETLERLSFLRKRNDPKDGRRIYVSLSEKGISAMQEITVRAKTIL